MLWTARLGLSSDATGRGVVAGRMLLAALVATNALTSMGLLAFIHVNGGAPGGDYSKSYARQLQESGSGISPRGPVSEPGKPD
jgi:hypothetical protein